MKILSPEIKCFSYLEKHICAAICLLLVGAFCIFFQKNACAEKAPYYILVTNDDGVESEGISALAKELEDVGQLLVVVFQYF